MDGLREDGALMKEVVVQFVNLAQHMLHMPRGAGPASQRVRMHHMLDRVTTGQDDPKSARAVRVFTASLPMSD